jgi:hypothetical protein
MKKFPILIRLFFAAAPPLLAALFLAVLPCRAGDAPKIPKQLENRFLLVVDTSSAMRGCSNSVVQGVLELLESDMRGEFRQGDTIGLWAYNDKLHPEFPMQVWSKADKDTIMMETAIFLQGQRYGRRAHFERVMPALNQVIKNSERITVVLISDGTGLIQGTPFDQDINNLQKKYARQLRAAHMPFVIVLAARNGVVFDCTINYTGLVAIPHTANPEIPAVTNAPVATMPNPAKPRPMRSLIMSAPTNVVHPAAPAPAAVAAPVASSPAPPLVVTPVSAPPPAAAVAPAPESQPTNAAAAPSPREIAPPPTQSAPPLVVAPAPAPQPVVPTVPTPLPVVPVASVPTLTPLQTQPAPPPIVARQNPEPAEAAAPPAVPPANVTADNQQPPPAPAVTPNAPVANIGPSPGSQLVWFITAFLLLTIAVVLVVFLVRRSRGAAQSSLITQSIDRPR